ncbi:MAG: FecR family protein [Acidobacteriota bacterium]
MARRRARRRSRRLAVAAALTVVAGLGAWRMFDRPLAATVEVYAGPDNGRFVVGSILAAGTRLDTADDEHLTVATASGHQLRLAAGSRVELLSASRIELLRGAVYIDAAPPALAVQVAGSVVEHVGTRYRVELGDEGRAEVRVRDGRVRLRGPTGTVDFGRGRAATWTAGEAARLVDAPPHGESWAWTLAAAPLFDPDGATLAEFLDWLEAESGWMVEIDSALLVDAYGDPVRITGSIHGLPLDQAARFVLGGAGLSFHQIEDRLTVHSADSPSDLDAPSPPASEAELGR